MLATCSLLLGSSWETAFTLGREILKRKQTEWRKQSRAEQSRAFHRVIPDPTRPTGCVGSSGKKDAQAKDSSLEDPRIPSVRACRHLEDQIVPPFVSSSFSSSSRNGLAPKKCPCLMGIGHKRDRIEYSNERPGSVRYLVVPGSGESRSTHDTFCEKYCRSRCNHLSDSSDIFSNFPIPSHPFSFSKGYI